MKKALQTIIAIATVIGTLGLGVGCVAVIRQGWSAQDLELFLRQFGVWAPLVFVIFQMIQVIIPLVPGGVSVGVGLVMFGVIRGTVYNYIGVMIGSILAFQLARHYGWSLVKLLTSEAGYQTARQWFNITPERVLSWPFVRIMPANWRRWLASDEHLLDSVVGLTMLVPGFPADILCFVFGMIDRVQLSRFVGILLIVKPINILLYGGLIRTVIVGIGNLF